MNTTQRHQIGTHLILQEGPTLIHLRPGKYGLLDFKVFHQCTQIGSGWIEAGEVRWSDGPEMEPATMALAEAIIREQMPEEFPVRDTSGDSIIDIDARWIPEPAMYERVA